MCLNFFSFLVVLWKQFHLKAVVSSFLKREKKKTINYSYTFHKTTKRPLPNFIHSLWCKSLLSTTKGNCLLKPVFAFCLSRHNGEKKNSILKDFIVFYSRKIACVWCLGCVDEKNSRLPKKDILDAQSKLKELLKL